MIDKDSLRLTQYSSGGGCGCKLDPDYLKKIINLDKKKSLNNNLLVSNTSSDDAAVYDLGDGTAIVSTTDFFTPIVDDPFVFGQIAATNALSDIYAMGASPLMALAILGWPKSKLSSNAASAVLDGAKKACRDINIEIAGGHSIESSEPIFGLSVTGRVKCTNIKRNSEAQTGDVIFLTKPLGIGLLTSAAKMGILSSKDKNKAEKVMTKINSVGEILGNTDAVSAMTDVTGFGLLGHLIEVCESSEASAALSYNKLPLISDFLNQYAGQNCETGGGKRNWTSVKEKVQCADENKKIVLCDPQTSGGLLVCVRSEKVKEITALLEKYGLYSQPVGYLSKHITGEKYVKVLP